MAKTHKKAPTYLIQPVPAGTPLRQAIGTLADVSTYLLTRLQDHYTNARVIQSAVALKRAEVKLPATGKPGSIGKDKEKVTEVMNVLASLERMLVGLQWAARGFPGATVQACHPSTSHTTEECDVIMNLGNGGILRAEVCDIVAAKAGQNRKEPSQLRNLCGGAGEFPLAQSSIRLMVWTSPEYADGLTRTRRKMPVVRGKPCKYSEVYRDQATGTVLLDVLPAHDT